VDDELLVRVMVVCTGHFTHEIDPGYAYYIEEHGGDWWNTPNTAIGYKERSATATLDLPGTAMIEIMLNVEDEVPTPAYAELAAFTDDLVDPNVLV
jgi:hypothetical protein